MSFKGITWAGNVYEKFEAMCLEVEEAMYQDTVKYVENQVQKVGVSVKKFYSEVMDDMRPLSCIDPTSVADDLSPIPYGYTDVNKKPTPGILDNRRDLKKKKNDDQVLLNITAEKGSSNVCLFSPQSPGIFIEHKSPEKCAVSKKIGVQRRAIGIKRISKSNYPSKDSCRTTSTSEDKGSKVASCDTRTNSRLASDNMDVTSSSDFAGRCGAREAVKGNAPNLNHSIESPASDEVLLPQSVRQDSLRASSRLASDNMDVTSSSDFAGRCEAREAVKGNAPNLNHPIESPASDEVLSSESVRQDSLRAACDDSIVTSSSNIMMQEHAEAVKGNTALQDNLIKSPASEKALLAESMRQIGDVSDCIPPDSDSNLSDDSVRLKGDPEATTSCSGSPAESAGMSVNDIVACSSFRTEVCNLEYEEKGTVSNEGTSIKDCSLSADSPSCNVESSNKDFIITNKDSFDMEFVENNEVSELREVKFETDNGRRDLEESCIFVDGDELHFDLQGTRKHKSYKKRIREALSSKLRSRKDEQLVFCEDKQEMSDRARARAVESEEQKLSAFDSVESDWELL